MKLSKRQALREEGVPQAWIDDPGLLAHLDASENERIAAEAREEYLTISNSAALPDLFGAAEKKWDWTPKVRHTPSRKPIPRIADTTALIPQAQIAFREQINRRAYRRDVGQNTFNWNGDEAGVKAALLHNSLKEALELSPFSTAYNSVWLWIRLPDRDNPFSFSECCCVLSQDADILRDHMNGLRCESLDRETWLKTERQFLVHEIVECQLTARSLREWEHVGQLRDDLASLDDAPYPTLTEKLASKSLQRELYGIQALIQDHIGGMTSPLGPCLETHDLVSMAADLQSIAGRATCQEERKQIEGLKESIEGLLKAPM
jgi:hypothetical protein